MSIRDDYIWNIKIPEEIIVSLPKIASGEPLPSIVLPLVGGGTHDLAGRADSKNWKLVVVYRGLHCPLCTKYLLQLETLQATLAEQWIEVVAVSADPREKAESRVEQSGLTLPVAYDLSIAQMVQLGLYISNPASEKETDRPFAEPGVFAINEGGLLQLVDVSNAPFLRPELDAVLGGISYVRKPQAERLDPFGESYPIRGTHIPSQ